MLLTPPQTVPVPEDQLPVVLPTVESVKGSGAGSSPLARETAWATVACPQCGRSDAQRETDTMDTFMDSSWYFLRFCSDHFGSTSAKGRLPQAITADISKWMPIDTYIGGIEHAIMHLLYARFISLFLHDQSGAGGGSYTGEPFMGLITQGLVEGITHKCPTSGRYLRPEEIACATEDQAASGTALPAAPGSRMIVRASGLATVASWEKMSKSKYNGVDPLSLVQAHGADALRLCVLFKAPPEVPLQWSDRDISGSTRWLVRLFNLASAVAARRTEPVPLGGAVECGEEAMVSAPPIRRTALSRAVDEAIAKASGPPSLQASAPPCSSPTPCSAPEPAPNPYSDRGCLRSKPA